MNIPAVSIEQHSEDAVFQRGGGRRVGPVEVPVSGQSDAIEELGLPALNLHARRHQQLFLAGGDVHRPDAVVSVHHVQFPRAVEGQTEWAAAFALLPVALCK